MGDRRLAALVGNGLSIAVNPDLTLARITTEVRARIKADTGDDAADAMSAIADRTSPHGTPSDADFEVLVGAFGAERRNLDLLPTMVEAIGQGGKKKLRRSIERAARFASRVQDRGISHVLEVIADRSRAGADSQPLRDLLAEVIDRFDHVCFGNLNYDTLLLTALLHICDTGTLADIADGRHSSRVAFSDERKVEGRSLRTSAKDFPDDRPVQLLHLHGSLTYWCEHDEHTKVPHRELDGTVWQAVRDQSTTARPDVILTNQRDKAAAVESAPFALAYDMFGAALREAARWLIIGYSFRDIPVNNALQAALRRDDPPEVLVITHGCEPGRRRIESALGWDREHDGEADWLAIDRDGATGAHERRRWKRFAR